MTPSTMFSTISRDYRRRAYSEIRRLKALKALGEFSDFSETLKNAQHFRHMANTYHKIERGMV